MKKFFTKKTNIEARKENSSYNILNESNSFQITKSSTNNEIPNFDHSGKCILKGRFESIFPSFDSYIPLNQKSAHYINLFEINKATILYYLTSNEIIPTDMKMPYTDFSKKCNIYNCDPHILKSTDPTIQIIIYDYLGKSKYVLKRGILNIKKDNIDNILIRKVNEFAGNKYNEYGLIKLFNASPYGAIPIDFNIVYNSKLYFLATEFLMTFAGNSIINYPLTTSQDILTYFDQMIEALHFMENYKIEHNDIKPGNIVVEELFDIKIIKFIDFDIGRNYSATSKSKKIIDYHGHSPAYVAPEIILGLKKYDPWKSQMYSIGILMLRLMNFFSEFSNINLNNEFDGYKENPDKYTEFLNKLQDYYFEEKDSLKKKILFLIILCLIYDPEKRLNASEMIELLDNINSKTPIELKDQYEDIIQHRQKTNETLENEISIQEQELEHLNRQKDSEIQAEILNFTKIFEENKILANNIQEMQKQIENLQLRKKANNEVICKMKEEINELKLIKKNNKQIEEETKKITKTLKKQGLINSSKNISLNKYCEIILKYKEEAFCTITPILQSIDKIEKEENYNYCSNLLQKLLIPFFALFQGNTLNIWRFNSLIILTKSQHLLNFEISISKVDDLNKLATQFGITYDKGTSLCFGKLSSQFCIEEGFKLTGIDGENFECFYGNLNLNKEHSQGFGVKIFSENIIIKKKKKNSKNSKNSINSPPSQKTCQLSYYKGDFMNDKMEGKGIYINSNYTFKGDFINNMQNGKGKTIYSNGDNYVGFFKNNNKDGAGKYTFKNGSYYDGTYKENMRSGQGKECKKYYFTYVGEFNNNQKSGEGKIQYTNGNSYEGDFLENKKMGKGNLTMRMEMYLLENLAMMLPMDCSNYYAIQAKYMKDFLLMK